MSVPERLEDDAPPARRRTWVVLAVALAVVAGLVVVRLTGATTERSGPPVPTGTRTTSEDSTGGPGAWPRGLPSGTLYVLGTRDLVSIDLGSGLVRRMTVELDPVVPRITGAGLGVVIWSTRGRPPARAMLFGSTRAFGVDAGLAAARQVLPGPGTSVWGSAAGAATTTPTTWRLSEVDGPVKVTQEVRLGGPVTTDGAGGLFAHDRGRVQHVVPGAAPTSFEGRVLAAGRDGWEVLRCRGTRCTDVLHDRATGRETTLAASTPADSEGAVLAPGNRAVAWTVRSRGETARAVAVGVLPRGRAARPGPSPHRRTAARWPGCRNAGSPRPTPRG